MLRSRGTGGAGFRRWQGRQIPPSKSRSSKTRRLQGRLTTTATSTSTHLTEITTRQPKVEITSSLDNYSSGRLVDCGNNGNGQGCLIESSNHTGAIVGGSVAAVCLLVIGLVTVGFILYRRKKFQKHSPGDSVYQSDPSNGNAKTKPQSLDNPAYETDHIIQNGHFFGVTEPALPSKADIVHTYDTIGPTLETAHPSTTDAQISTDDIDLVDNDVYSDNDDHASSTNVTSHQSHASGGIGEDTDLVDNEVYAGSDDDSKTNVIKDTYSHVNGNGRSKDTLMVDNDMYAGNDSDVITDDASSTYQPQNPNDDDGNTLMADNDVYAENDDVSAG